MTIKIAICDDEKLIHKQLGNAISMYMSSRNLDYDIFYFSQGIDLLEICNQIDFAFIFLDIDLGHYNGVDIAKSIRQRQHKPVNIVFVTNFPEYQTKVISIHIFDYLIKPIQNTQIYNVLDDLMFWYNKEGKKQKERIVFKTINGLVTIYIEEILYFEYNSRRIDIVTKEHTYHMYGKIKDLYKEMEKYNFAFPHAAYIINMREIKQYFKTENKLIMTNNEEIPISQLRSKELKKKYVNFISKLWGENNR